MRTVSFSNSDVRNILNRDFINTFSNTTGDPTAGKSIWHKPDDLAGECARGLGGQNVQTLFMTPRGEIFHAANGFLSSDDLLGEIKFAHKLYDEIVNSEESAKEVVRRAHRERLENLGYDARDIDDALSSGPSSLIPIQGDIEPGNIFAGKSKRQILMGNCFSINHPMMDYRKFEKDPTSLVGRGSSSFVSTRSDGTTPRRGSTDTGARPSGDAEQDQGKGLPRGLPIFPEGFPQIR